MPSKCYITPGIFTIAVGALFTVGCTYQWMNSRHMCTPSTPDPESTHYHSTLKQVKGQKVNTPTWQSDPDLHQRILQLASRKAESDDPELLAVIRELLDPPSRHRMLKRSGVLQETPQSKAVRRALHNKVHQGFFVECGALDGETSSNTLILEQRHGWSGILVEMDPYYYTQLLGKSRRAWSINACLSPYPYVSILKFAESSGGLGHLQTEKAPQGQRTPPTLTSVCFPLVAILLALGTTHVNYLSLDVEGREIDVINTLPSNKTTVDIDVISLEYAHGGLNQSDYRRILGYHGYRLYQDVHVTTWFGSSVFAKDYVFVKDDLLQNKTTK